MSIQEIARFTTGPQTRRVNVIDKDALAVAEARKYSLPSGNETVYSLSRLAASIGCKVGEIYAASQSKIHRGVLVTLTSGLQKEIPLVYLQDEMDKIEL